MKRNLVMTSGVVLFVLTASAIAQMTPPKGGGGATPCKFSCKYIWDFTSKHTADLPTEPPTFKYWTMDHEGGGCFQMWRHRTNTQMNLAGLQHTKEYRQIEEQVKDCEPSFDEMAELTTITILDHGPSFPIICHESCILAPPPNP